MSDHTTHVDLAKLTPEQQGAVVSLAIITLLEIVLAFNLGILAGILKGLLQSHIQEVADYVVDFLGPLAPYITVILVGLATVQLFVILTLEEEHLGEYRGAFIWISALALILFFAVAITGQAGDPVTAELSILGFMILFLAWLHLTPITVLNYLRSDSELPPGEDDQPTVDS